MLMPCIIPVLLFITRQHTSYYLIIIIIYYTSPQFIFCSFFPHISLSMADANAIYHPSLIIYYSSTQFILFYFTYLFSHQHIFFYFKWIVDANFILILVFISSYVRSVWHPFGCFILCMVYLILNYFILCCFLSTHFHHVHPTLYKYFFIFIF